MNLFLHKVGDLVGEPTVNAPALPTEPPRTFDDVMLNPPFGKKSSMTFAFAFAFAFTHAEGEDDRESLSEQHRQLTVTQIRWSKRAPPERANAV